MHLIDLFDAEFVTLELSVADDLCVQGSNVTATFNNKTIMSLNVPSLSSPSGFVAVGPDRFGVASFDNLRITRADRLRGRDHAVSGTESADVDEGKTE